MSKDEIIASLDREVNSLTRDLLAAERKVAILEEEKRQLQGTIQRVKNALEERL